MKTSNSYLEKLTFIQQTNNKILTTKRPLISDICKVINWLFIIWFWLVKELPVFIGYRHFLFGLF